MDGLDLSQGPSCDTPVPKISLAPEIFLVI